jgi:hypothetical protein
MAGLGGYGSIHIRTFHHFGVDVTNKPSAVACSHANECPQECPCPTGCYCILPVKDGGSGMCHPATMLARAQHRKAKDEDPNGHLFDFMEEALTGFSYVKWAEDNKKPKYDLNFGELGEPESLMARRFMDLHNSIHGTYAGAAGGRYSWRITSTGIGTITVVVCGACGEELDVTDYESW